MRKLLTAKLCSRNIIKGINIWAVSFVRYDGAFLKWIKGGPQTNKPKDKEIDGYTHLTKDIDCVLRKVGERGFTCIEDCIEASIQGLEENYFKKSKKRLITAASNRIGKIRTDRQTNNKN